jgi:hypothetical protein
VPNLPRLRALALFGRRPPQRVEGLVMPASKNLHKKRPSYRLGNRRLVAYRTSEFHQLVIRPARARRIVFGFEAGKFMNFDLILVTGPLVGASSWKPTADCLRAAGAHVEVPNVLSGLKNPPAWSEWTAHLTSRVPINGGQIFVGHSSASALVAEMAGKFPCKGIIVVDGEIPPATGRTPPIRASFRQYINGLADVDGELPPWSRWFSNDQRRETLVGIDILRSREENFAIFESDYRK